MSENPAVIPSLDEDGANPGPSGALPRGLPMNTLAVTEAFDSLSDLESLRVLMGQFRQPEFTVHILYPSPERKTMAALIWRRYQQALRSFSIGSWVGSLPFFILAEFVGVLRQYGEIPDQEHQEARRALVYAHVEEQGLPGWLAGLALTSLYDSDMVSYLQYSVLLQEATLLPITLSWMSMAWVAPGTLTAAMHRNRSFIFDWITRYAEKARLLIPQSAFLDAYWTADPTKYAGLRAAFGRWAETRGIVNHPVLAARNHTRPKIGIVSGNWRDRHSVRKALLSTVVALREHAEVYLVDTNLQETSKVSDFDGVIRVTTRPDPGNPGLFQIEDQSLADAQFNLLYFAETFQAEIDTLLQTRRYAPVQVTGYGIPVSTRSPHMDYFIGGALVEGKGAAGYSETLIRVPGIGMLSERRPDGPSLEKAPGELRVVVAANLQKLTVDYLKMLGQVALKVPHAHWIFLPNTLSVSGLWAAEMVCQYIPADKVQWYTQVDTMYQPILRSADLILDAHPYSGYTTIIDAVSARIPVLTWRGTHAHERLAAAVAQQGGMPAKWVARDLPDLGAKAVRLLSSPFERQLCKLRMGKYQHRAFAQDHANAIAAEILKLLN